MRKKPPATIEDWFSGTKLRQDRKVSGESNRWEGGEG